MGTPITPAYLSLRDAALYSGISARTWYWLWANQPDTPRRIQVGGPGGKIMVSRADIDTFLDGLKQEPGATVDKIVHWATKNFNRKGSQN